MIRTSARDKSAFATLLAKMALLVTLASRRHAIAFLLIGLSLLAEYRLAAVVKEPRATALAKQPPDHRPPTTDRYGDALPHGAFARMGTVRFRTGGDIFSLAYSPNGKTLASASRDGTFRLWQTATGKELHRFTVYGAPASTVAFSGDGKVLAGLGADSSITLWDTASAKELFRLHDLRTGFTCFALAPGDKVLAVGVTDATRNKGFLRLYSAETRKVIREMNGETARYFRMVVFAPDGKTVAAGSGDKTIRVWDVATGKERYRIATPVSWGNALTFSPDGKILASVGEHGGAVFHWDSRTGKELRRLPIPRTWLWTVAFSPDGKKLAAAGQTVHLWDVDSGKAIRQFENVSASSVVFSPNGRTLAVGCHGGGALRFWDVGTGNERFPDAGHTGGIWSSVPSPDGRLLATGGGDSSVRLWEVRTGRELRSLTVDGHAVLRVAFSPDGKTVASSGLGGYVLLWEVSTGTEVGRLKAHKHAVNAVVFSPDGNTLATASGDEKTVRLWEVKTRKELRRLEGQWVEAIAWSPDGKLLACGSLDITVGREKLIRIVEAATGKELRRFECGMVRSLAFSPDGKLLASSGHADAVRLWNPATGKEVRRLERSREELHVTRDVFCVAFSPDGRTLASAEEDGICLWEVSTGQKRRLLRGHQGSVFHVAFSAGGKVLLSSGVDTTALAWNTFAPPSDRVPRTGKLPAKALESAWADLGGQDVARAFDAICVLLAVPEQTMDFLREKMPPVRAADARRMDRLLAGLGSKRFATRRQAMQELEQLGESAVPALRRALQESLPLELRRRIEQLLEGQESKRRATLRAFEILEHAGDAARGLLERIADGTPESPITQEAKAALHRQGHDGSR